LDKLRVENRTFAKITPRDRLERKMVDETALREAFINAVVHNDYSREVPPVVEIFSDRLTITSYGGLPQGLSRENFFRCRSLPRNRELMRVFKDVGLVEHLGSGMGRILSAYDESIFSFEEGFLVVTFPFANGFSHHGDGNSDEERT
jgi:predicted HTH transcriptional regulator